MKFVPENLKSARMINGLSLQGLADRLKELQGPISKQALNKYEQGQTVPDAEMIGLLANALELRPEYFYNRKVVEFGPIEYRKLKGHSAKESNRIIELSRDLLRRYLELEDILGIDITFKNPLVDFTITDLNSVEEAADKLRKEWGLGINPIPKWT